MSHWQKAKLKLKCSIGELIKALNKIKKEWAQHIQISQTGELTIENTYTHETEGGYSVKIPQGAGGLRYADLGFKKQKDGTWGITVDHMGLPGDVRNLEDQLKMAVVKEKLENLKRKAFGVTEESQSDNGYKLRLIIPVGQKYKVSV